jgi:anaerobic sulfite reductase subunit A
MDYNNKAIENVREKRKETVLGYVLNREETARLFQLLGGRYRLYAPVRKEGEGRFTATDVIRYEDVAQADEIEWDVRSDYSFKEILTPLSETLFYFTENEVKEADTDAREVLVFLRNCDLCGLQRLDQIYLGNGEQKDWFYRRLRDKVKFVLMGCAESCADGFCVDMKSNRAADGYVMTMDAAGTEFRVTAEDDSIRELLEEAGARPADVTPARVTENRVHVTVPEQVPNSIYQSPMWEEYSVRCINCGRCNFVCPTCTCFTMQDIFYTDNGKVGERRRVSASCMVDGYTNVAGGGQYRRSNGERMRFKVLHKVYDFRRRFGYDMCVGCGRCDTVCPEYISYSACINKLNQAVRAEAGKEE